MGRDAMDVTAAAAALARSVRNAGRPGIASTAIAAVDVALWDLKARLLDVPLVSLLGAVREAIPIYGSGGFTSYTESRLEAQLGGWAEQGIGAVKMKIGRDAAADRQRVRRARAAIGPDVGLFVDANGAYDRKEALQQADVFAHEDVAWFEEPVTSDDLEGLRLIRDRAPVVMDVAAGEYGYDIRYFRRMLAAGAVDVLQADATRCGITGFLEAAALCDAWSMPLSAHTAPALHVHLCCAAPRARNLEYFHDHVRLERSRQRRPHLLERGSREAEQIGRVHAPSGREQLLVSEEHTRKKRALARVGEPRPRQLLRAHTRQSQRFHRVLRAIPESDAVGQLRENETVFLDPPGVCKECDEARASLP